MKIAWLPEKNRKKVIVMLNELLADEFILYLKTLNFHWNLKGPHFNHMHQFFKKQYEQLLDITDDVAERVRALDGRAIGTMTECLKLTRLKEEPGSVPDIKGMVTLLLADYDAIIAELRAGITECETEYKDSTTSNFLAELAMKQEKMAWMLRASLE
jgi:starvation-inducible DNA-binding protein